MLVNPISIVGGRDVAEKRFMELLGLEGLYGKLDFARIPNLEEINEVEYWWHRTSYSFKAEMWAGQQKIAERDPGPKNIFGNPHWAHLMFYLVDQGQLQGGGFMVMFTYNWMDYNKATGKGRQLIGQAAWDDNFQPVRYFQWRVCAHEYEETGPVEWRSRGWHEYKCKKCGAKDTIDSGD